MARVTLFPSTEPSRLPGLSALSGPDAAERVAAVVDIAVVGARSDGKTQFILHAIRTLGADVPDDLPAAERRPTLDIMQVVLAAASPRPDANNPEAGVPHYVFRLRTGKVLEQIGFLAQLALLALHSRAARWVGISALVASAGAIAGAAVGGLDAAPALGLVWLAATVAAVTFFVVRRRFLRRGPVEVVFWDVAGENLYGARHKAADYWALLRALVQRRSAEARADRPYGFAPVLICNPLGLGVDADDSPYGRLKPLLPIFAALGRSSAEALIVINRWDAVRAVCSPGADRDELVAIIPEADTAPAPVGVVTGAEPLPVVRRGTVQTACVDLEDSRDDGIHTTVLRYDAGLCEVTRAPWQPPSEWSESERARFALPSVTPKETVRYRYREGPRAFQTDSRRVFLRWVARLAFGSSPPAPAPAVATAEAAPAVEPPPAQTLQMFPADEKAGGFRSGGT